MICLILPLQLHDFNYALDRLVCANQKVSDMSNFTTLLDLEVAELTSDELRDAIYRDHLTGIWNRRALEMHPLFQSPVYVALIDLDSPVATIARIARASLA